MFISTLELFKIGIGPSSSHTTGPMAAAKIFIGKATDFIVAENKQPSQCFVRCTLKGSLSFTGKGHATDRAVALGLHGYSPENLIDQDTETLINQIWQRNFITIDTQTDIVFRPKEHIVFDQGEALAEHPNGMIFDLIDIKSENTMFSEVYFSIGGGFISTKDEINQVVAPLKMEPFASCSYPFDSARSMLQMATENNLSIAEMKRLNELDHLSVEELDRGLDQIWISMQSCIEKGLQTGGFLPGGLTLPRRAQKLYQQLQKSHEDINVNDWLCCYAMAVGEENGAGHMVVTAPTNGAAGVIPAILYYLVHHEHGSIKQVREFLLTASAIGGIIKHRSSISGAEVGCQGEVGSAASMAAAGLCAVRGGTPEQIENAAEIALEHHLGMTCDPVKGLVQVPCIERNAFGAIKAYVACSLALRGNGYHFMPLDSCIAAMKQTGLEMSEKYKETSLGGLAVSITEC